MLACSAGMGRGVIRVFLSLDSRGGALEILIRWVPGLGM